MKSPKTKKSDFTLGLLQIEKNPETPQQKSREDTVESNLLEQAIMSQLTTWHEAVTETWQNMWHNMSPSDTSRDDTSRDDTSRDQPEVRCCHMTHIVV